MQALENLTAAFPDAARDIRLNLKSVLTESALEPRVRWAVALTIAHTLRDDVLRDAVLADGAEALDEAAREDAASAAALMAMNNVYYRFRHMLGANAVTELPARLRMTRLAAPKTSKAEFELLSIAASAVTGCEMCVRSHAASLAELGVPPAAVHDAVRIAAVLHAAAVSRRLGPAVPA
jgi:alkyl hydroperoxide reductase subunit D